MKDRQFRMHNGRKRSRSRDPRAYCLHSEDWHHHPKLSPLGMAHGWELNEMLGLPLLSDEKIVAECLHCGRRVERWSNNNDRCWRIERYVIQELAL